MQEHVDYCFCDNGLLDGDITSMKDKFHLQQFEINSILQSAYTHDGNMCVLVDWIGDYEPSWELLKNIKTSVENMPEHMVHSDIPVMLFEIKSISQIIKKKDGQKHVLVDWVGDYEPSWELLENMPISIRNWGNNTNMTDSAAFIEEFHEPVVPCSMDDRSDRPFFLELYENIKKGIRNWGKNNNVKESANLPKDRPFLRDSQDMNDFYKHNDFVNRGEVPWSSLQYHSMPNQHLPAAAKPSKLQNPNPQGMPQAMRPAMPQMYPPAMPQAMPQMYPPAMPQIYPPAILHPYQQAMPQTYPQVMQHPYQQVMQNPYQPVMQNPYQQVMPHQYQPAFQNPHQQINYIPLQAHQQIIPVHGHMLGPMHARRA